MAPLRERPLSNSPEPEWPPRATTPLRIAKRDTPQRQHASQVSRRASNTINRLKSSSLVSQSPFRSQVPSSSKPSSISSPSPRKVSGDKRPRPSSMHDQAENEKPLGIKRRQSKAFEGLIEKEPVTKSPFRAPYSGGDDLSSPPLPVPQSKREHDSHAPGSPSSGSPTRSSLVSKRFHGPRTLGHEPSKRQRRKTVTWGDCDVLEFSDDMAELEDEEEEEESLFENEEYDEDGGEEATRDTNADDSITGLVESMLQEALPETPLSDQFLPHEADATYDGPNDRSLDAEHSTRDDNLSTSPETSTVALGADASPVSRTENIRVATASSIEYSFEDDMDLVTSSTPPARNTSSTGATSLDRPGRATTSEAGLQQQGEMAGELDVVPMASSGDDMQIVELSFMSASDAQDDLDVNDLSARLDFGAQSPGAKSSPRPTSSSTPPLRAKPSNTSLRRSLDINRELPTPPRNRSASPFAPSPAGVATSSASSLHASPVSVPPSAASPPQADSSSSSSSLSLNSLGRSKRGPRISRQDVHRRLLLSRHTDNPASDEEMASRQPSIDTDGEESLVHDAVTSINIGPRPTDPQEPVLASRAESDDDPARTTAASGFTGLDLTFPSSNGTLELGFHQAGFGSNNVDFGGVKSALDKLVDEVAQESATEPRGKLSHDSPRPATVSPVTPPHNLDRAIEQESTMDVDDDDDSETESTESHSASPSTPSTLLHGNSFKSPPLSRSVSGASMPPAPAPPPPPPPKDAIKSREQVILEKRREMRRREEEEAMGLSTPPRVSHKTDQDSTTGRPSARRSMSTGDVEETRTLERARLEAGIAGGSEDDELGATISRELRKLGGSKNKYHIKEHETIYASSDADKISHLVSAGDLNSGKAWRTVRRPSDMNEYAKQIREYRAQEKPGKGHGKVFVRVLEVRNLKLPFPQQATALTCTLNNGIHFVTTPESRLAKECRIEQEFELIEHSKLEFTLTLKIRRDPHIVAQFKANAPKAIPPPAPVVPPPAPKGGVRGFFSSSPKKPARPTVAPPPPAPVQKVEENLARYLKPDGTLARAFVSFKDIASHCDTRLFETSFPLIGQRLETGSKANSLQVGELVLQFFRLPPLPGISASQLPQSLEECHRGLRHVHWHKLTYFEGVLTQSGGDCRTWRRRQFRIIGANLVAFNDVTKRATAIIDLRKSLAVEDLQDPAARVLSPSSARGLYDEYEYGVERSFRLNFQHDEDILFFADSDAEKTRWMEVLRALVGRVPPNPLWAELLWQRQQELTNQSKESRQVGSPATS